MLFIFHYIESYEFLIKIFQLNLKTNSNCIEIIHLYRWKHKQLFYDPGDFLSILFSCLHDWQKCRYQWVYLIYKNVMMRKIYVLIYSTSKWYTWILPSVAGIPRSTWESIRWYSQFNFVVAYGHLWSSDKF